MDIFDFRNALTRDYSEYARSFINIRTEDVRGYVEQRLDGQELWPEPLLQLNPAYASGASIPSLVERGLLHTTTADVFRHGKSDSSFGVPLNLYKHQVEAIETARAGHDYVVTTGTGSGKSLTYIVPIVDHVLRAGSGQGIKAIIVYPMNALANSQAGELKKFLGFGFEGTPPVTVARYTGQDDETTRAAIKASPPDVLLTNYVMLELLLTRGHDQAIIKAASDLKFLVFDELHTYRGRQGADVAMLIRRVRDRVGGSSLQFVGTSATMGSRGNLAEQRAEVASVATRVFGRASRQSVIGETLTGYQVNSGLPDLPALLRTASRPSTRWSTPFADFVSDLFRGSGRASGVT